MFLPRPAFILAIGLWISGCTPSAVAPPMVASNKAFMAEKGRTLAPFPHVAFCLKYPDQCEDKGGGAVVTLDAKNQAMIDGVNSAINSAIVSREDPARTGTWEINPPAGDCNDYAVSKRSELIEGGLPERAVRLAIGMTPEGIGHTVVVIRTTNGDMVIDNRNYDIKRWDRTDLAWLKVQSSANPKLWDSL